MKWALLLFLVACQVSIVDTGVYTSDVIVNDSVGRMIQFDSFSGFLVNPGNSSAGVVLIHEWWGLNEHIKSAAVNLSKEGFVVLAVDLYGEVASTPERARQLSSGVRQNQGPAVDNLRSAVNYLRSLGVVSVASMGWCFGGQQSLLLALSGESLDATVIYYGNLVSDPARLSVISWPVLGVFGDVDSSIPVDSVNNFTASLDSLNISNEIYIYPGVGHAFANPSGANFAPVETADAWSKTVAFLRKHLD